MNSEISLFYGAAWYGVFLFSTVIHEASHALASLKLGDDTARVRPQAQGRARDAGVHSSLPSRVRPCCRVEISASVDSAP